MTTSNLDALLRDTDLTHGRICLYTENGRWYSTVTHFHGRMTSMGGEPWVEDPVEALRVALVEDARYGEDLKRRYDAAPKLGGVEPEFDNEFEGLFS